MGYGPISTFVSYAGSSAQDTNDSAKTDVALIAINLFTISQLQSEFFDNAAHSCILVESPEDITDIHADTSLKIRLEHDVT